MGMTTLSTIGYEGKTVDEFLGELAAGGIELLIDVRAVAASRRPGFSKTALAAAVRERGVDYLHLRALGTPKAGRDAARKGRIAEMQAIFEDQLQTPEAGLAMEQLRDSVKEKHVALLCFERDAACCHRAVLASRLARSEGVKIVNL
jgi:uncharacterized protein (DUF488 family)